MTPIRFNEDCGKVMYPKLKDAKTVLNRLKTYRGKHAVERIYQCKICGCYHFTSAELDSHKVPNGAYTEPKFADRWKKLIDDQTDPQEQISEQGCLEPPIREHEILQGGDELPPL